MPISREASARKAMRGAFNGPGTGERAPRPGAWRGRAVRTGQLLGHRRLEDRHGLAELHRPALELAEDLEDLLGRAGLHLGGDQLGRLAAHPLADAEGGAPGEAERERGELDRAGDGLAGEFAHRAIVVLRQPAQPHSGWSVQRRCATRGQGSDTSSDTPRGTCCPSSAVCTTIAQSPAAIARQRGLGADRGRRRDRAR